jgi:predicted dehydrogenase
LTRPLSAGKAGSTRRDFLTTTAAAGASLVALPALAPYVHAAGGDTLKVGLIGCGNRGRGAATQALLADANVKLVALGDTFKDQVQEGLDTLRRDKSIAAKVDVKPEHCYDGFSAYKQVIDSGVDVVLLATPPHFRPLHLEAAIAAGKHVFAEKPVAVDAPGVRRVLAACAEAKKKNLSVVSGLCYRYEKAKRETIQRVHDGAVGDVVALHCTYNARGLWHKPREANWSDMEWQVRNWLYFTWLSGDHIVEQNVHSLDKMAWVMHDQPPVKASGVGGRQSRTQKEFGQIFDHHAVVYEYANGVKLFNFCRQQNGTDTETSDYVLGTKGTCDVMRHTITHGGKVLWKHGKDLKDNMYQNEHDELFASIRAGKPINNGDYMCRSTLLAIMGRMATYTGKVVTWKQAENSKKDLSPAKYEFGPLAVAEVARPGITKLD